jgi:hypothetical protein
VGEERRGVMEKEISLSLHLSEDDTETLAHAVLNLRGDHFEAMGKARRNPEDAPMPVVGEELAIARVLQEITGQVMTAAQNKIEEFLVHD